MTEVDDDTELVFTVKVALVLPPETVTLNGTLATFVSLLDRLTTAPPLGAGPLRVTVPVEEFPPGTVDGLRVSDVTVGRGGGVTLSVSVVVLLKPPEVPVMVIVKVPVVALLLAVRVKVLLVAVGLGLNPAVTPLGRPEADKVTLPLKPFWGATVMVLWPLLPWVMVTLLGEAERE